jgi:hypothetical protein
MRRFVAVAAVLLAGCGDATLAVLEVGDDNVVSPGRAGDVAVAWSNDIGVAVWSALDTRQLRFIRIGEKGAPIGSLNFLPHARVTNSLKLRIAPAGGEFYVLAADTPESELFLLNPEGLVSNAGGLPAAISAALAPPIIALIEPVDGNLLIGELSRTMPRAPAPTLTTGQFAVGAAFANKQGVIVTVSRGGCVAGLPVGPDVKPTGRATSATCFGGAWDDATIAAWSPREGVFAAAVGLHGSIGGEAPSTHGFAVSYEIDAAGELELLQAAPAPIAPSGSGFYGRGNRALQIASAADGAIASLFDAEGHPVADSPAIAWRPPSGGFAHAITPIDASTWLVLDAVDGATAPKSFVFARTITETSPAP